jgi:hypothetical protein
MIKNAVKGSRDIICHLNNVLPWEGSTAAFNPFKVSQESGAIIDGWVHFGFNTRGRYLGVGVPVVVCQ